MSKILVVLNPAAGTATGQMEAVQQHAAHHAAQLVTPQSPSELASVLADAMGHGTERILVCGGDGTISRVVNGLAPFFADVTLGIVPLGTGNDLARSLDLLALLDVESSFERAAIHDPVAIDLVHVQSDREFFFVNAATAGFGAEITASLSAEDKQLWGAFAYWLTATKKLGDMHEFGVELSIDGDPLRFPAFGLTLANGRFTGGGFPVASSALLNDGWLDLVLVPVLSTIELLNAGLTYMVGWESAAVGVMTRRVQRLVVRSNPPMPFSFDGEPTLALDLTMDLTMELVPKRLRVVTGDHPAISPP